MTSDGGMRIQPSPIPHNPLRIPYREIRECCAAANRFTPEKCIAHHRKSSLTI
jgi:hypothetical protein